MYSISIMSLAQTMSNILSSKKSFIENMFYFSLNIFKIYVRYSSQITN